MKKWYQWFGLSLIFAVGGMVNYLNDEQTIAAIIQVGITVTLAFVQLLCDKNGEKGKKVFNYISIAVIALLIIWMVYLVFSILG